jgi:SagB-type dehydrogenase family enzyme
MLERSHDIDLNDLASCELSELFHENTKFRAHEFAHDQAVSPLEVSDYRLLSQPTERHRGCPAVELPAPLERESPSLQLVLSRRRSARDFAGKPISLGDLATILGLSYGVTGTISHPGGYKRSVRAAPSAGALYPTEIYVAATNVRGLSGGLYYYDPERHLLRTIRTEDPSAALSSASLEETAIARAAVALVFVASMVRSRRKYGDRGYRYALLDAGHVAQNVCLSATSLHVQALPTCSFVDDDLNRYIAVDGVDEAVVYLVLLGGSARGACERPGDA